MGALHASVARGPFTASMALAEGLLACSVVLALAAAGWSYDPTDLNFGPCVWYQYAPRCQQSTSACTALGAPARTALTDDGQGSPISLSTTAITNTRTKSLAAVRASLCLSRVFPLVQMADESTGTQLAGSTPSTTPSTVRLEMDGGGALVARCTSYGPLFLQVGSCAAEVAAATSSESEDSSEDESTAVSLASDVEAGLYEVMGVFFYRGLLHAWPDIDGEDFPQTSADYEGEIHLRRAKSIGDATVAPPVFTSRCFTHTLHRAAPDLLLSFSLRPSSTITTVNVSVVTRLLDAVGTAGSSISAGSGYVVDLNDTFPLMPFNAVSESSATAQSTAATVASAFMRVAAQPTVSYTGSVVAPPCDGAVPRVIISQSLLVPTDVSTFMATAFAGTTTSMSGVLLPLLSTTTVSMGSLYQVLHEVSVYTGESVSDSDSSSSSSSSASEAGEASREDQHAYRVALPVLIVVNCVFVLYIVLLALARVEWIAWPTGLGGLNHELQLFLTDADGMLLPSDQEESKGPVDAVQDSAGSYDGNDDNFDDDDDDGRDGSNGSDEFSPTLHSTQADHPGTQEEHPAQPSVAGLDSASTISPAARRGSVLVAGGNGPHGHTGASDALGESAFLGREGGGGAAAVKASAAWRRQQRRRSSGRVFPTPPSTPSSMRRSLQSWVPDAAAATDEDGDEDSEREDSYNHSSAAMVKREK